MLPREAQQVEPLRKEDEEKKKKRVANLDMEGDLCLCNDLLEAQRQGAGTAAVGAVTAGTAE